MAKFIKSCLIIGIVCIVLGALTSGAGIFNGGLSQLKEEVLRGEWMIGQNIELDPFFELEEQHYFDNHETIYVDRESVQNSFSKAEVRELYVKSAGVVVEVNEYDGEEFLVEATMVHEYQAFLKDRKLYVISKGQNTKEIGAGNVKIMVPTSVYDEGKLDIEVESAASKVSFDRVAGKDIELNVSAGALSWDSLSATEFSIHTSAGTVSGENTMITGESDIKVSAGNIEFTGVLGTETEIEMSAGKVEVTLLDSYTDYNYEISCAGGSVNVGKEKVEGVAKRAELRNGAAKQMDIECSVGAVKINFEE